MLAAACTAPDAAEHDAGLVEWFLGLTPAQRLAELESRVAFLTSLRRANEQLQPDP